MMKWVESKIDEVESEDEALASSRSVDNNAADRDANDKQDSARDVGNDGNENDAEQQNEEAGDQDGYFSGDDANEDVDDDHEADQNNNSGRGFTHQENSDNEE